MAKPKPDEQDALYLIYMRREKSRGFLNDIMCGLTRGVAINIKPMQMLDYLTNLIMCLELMLKLLSGNWRDHNVGQMYKEITGKDHNDPALMDSLKNAVMDQKYLLAPAAGIVDHIPELEELNDFLYEEIKIKHSGFTNWIEETVPDNFGQFLLAHVEQLYRGRVESLPPGMDFHLWMEGVAKDYQADVERIRKYLGAFLAAGCRFSLSNIEVRSLT